MDMISISMDKLSLASNNELKSSFSSEDLVLHDDDLLALILLRVPWKKLMSLKCVSRQWLSLITSSQFRKLLPPLRASGLFIHRLLKLGLSDELYLFPLDDLINIPPNLTLVPLEFFIPLEFYSLHSCNGLILCTTSIYAPHNSRNFYVWDPSTSQLDSISLHPPGARVRHIGLAFDPLKSIHYKVIAFVYAHGLKNVGYIHIYSSETCTWRVSVQSFNPAPYMNLTDGVYCNGRLHWLSELQDIKKSVPKSDVDVSECLCFNVDEERFETFPRPPIAVSMPPRKSLYFGESEGHLHFTEVFSLTTSLKVYEMKSDYSGWFVKYTIHLALISQVFPEMIQHKTCGPGKNNFAVAVHSLIRRESFQEDSLLVLEIPGKVICYNVADRSSKVILDFGADSDRTRTDYWEFGMLKVSQHIALL